MVVKRYVNDIFKMKKSVSVKNIDACFTLKILANQRFGAYAPCNVVIL